MVFSFLLNWIIESSVFTRASTPAVRSIGDADIKNLFHIHLLFFNRRDTDDQAPEFLNIHGLDTAQEMPPI
jgi:hypothetical protein